MVWLRLARIHGQFSLARHSGESRNPALSFAVIPA